MTPPPPPAAGFSWTPAPWGLRLSADALLPFVHGWTTRQLALRISPTGPAARWDLLARAAGVDEDAVIRLRQVHGAVLHNATRADMRGPVIEADLVSTDDPDLAVVVQAADCVPLLLVDQRSGRALAAHAGWRGTAANVAGVAASAFATSPGSSLRVAAGIGPSIGPCCYRVGPELVDRFRDAGWSSRETDAWFLQRSGDWYLDLWQANADQLAGRGVPRDAIHVSRLCTSCHADWFPSYRRDGADAGRLAGYVRARRGTEMGEQA